MTTQTWQQQLHGFQKGLMEFKRWRDEAQAAGNEAEAKKWDEALKGSAEGIRQWLAAQGL